MNYQMVVDRLKREAMLVPQGEYKEFLLTAAFMLDEYGAFTNEMFRTSYILKERWGK